MEPATLTIQRPLRSFRTRLLRWVIMCVIFVGGGVAGYCVGTMQLIGFVTPPTNKEPDKFTEWLLAHLKKDLTLTDDQYPRVEKVVRQHREAFERLNAQFRPLFEAEMAKMDREMLAVLDATQQELYKTRMQQRGSGRWGSGRSGSGRGGSRRGSEHNKGHDNKGHDKKDDKTSDEKSKAPLGHKGESSAKQPDSK